MVNRQGDDYFGPRIVPGPAVLLERWLREQFPSKDWHRHPRTDGRTDLCDGTPSDCASKERL